MLRKEPKRWASWGVRDGLKLHRTQLEMLCRGLEMLKSEPMRSERRQADSGAHPDLTAAHHARPLAVWRPSARLSDPKQPRRVRSFGGGGSTAHAPN